MSGSRPTPAEQHLGDRLAALVDGELNHDSRERVLAHLATCAKCKVEADAQRRLKDVFAHAAPPAPSAGFLARLQGLPGGSGTDGDDTDGTDGTGSALGRRRFGEGPVLGGFGADDALRFGSRIGYEGDGGAHPGVLPGTSRDRGFRIHEVGRADSERAGGRRPRRFAFAAASAVSLAAIALGGALPAETTNSPTARGERAGGLVPTRAATPAGGTDGSRRQGGATSVGGGAATTGAGGTALLSATTGNRAGTPSAPLVPSTSVPYHPSPYHRSPYNTGSTNVTVYPLALAQGQAQPPAQGLGRGHGQGRGRLDGVWNLPVSLLDGSAAPALIRPAPTAPPGSARPGPGHLAAPSTPELSVSRGR